MIVVILTPNQIAVLETMLIIRYVLKGNKNNTTYVGCVIDITSTKIVIQIYENAQYASRYLNVISPSAIYVTYLELLTYIKRKKCAY